VPGKVSPAALNSDKMMAKYTILNFSLQTIHVDKQGIMNITSSQIFERGKRE